MGEFLKFYENLYATGGAKNMEEVLNFIPHLVNDEMNAMLIGDVEETKVMKAAFEFMKAPGPDGYNGMFYQKY